MGIHSEEYKNESWQFSGKSLPIKSNGYSYDHLWLPGRKKLGFFGYRMVCKGFISVICAFKGTNDQNIF